MPKLLLHFIFLIVCLSLIPENAKAVSYKTYNLKYNIKVNIPVGWKIATKNELIQMSSLTGVEYLLSANGITLNKRDPPYFCIIVRKGKTYYTQKKLTALSLTDLQPLHDKAIEEAIKYNNAHKEVGLYAKIDLASVYMLIEHIDDVLALIKSYNTFIDGRNITTIEYNIPMQYGEIEITFMYNLKDKTSIDTMIDNILSSVKIGSKPLYVDEIETFLNTLRE